MIEFWFPTPIYSTMLSGVADLSDAAYDIQSKFPAQHEWDCDTYSSINHDLRLDQRFRPLLNLTAGHINEFAKNYGVISPQAEIIEAWVNIAGPGNYQEYHVHPNAHFSAVFYVKAPTKCGNIVFRNPVADIDMCRPQIGVNNEMNFDITQYEPQAGRLLIFRSFLRHMVLKNASNEDRVSIAMNWKVS
jgi:uncharacterized protein (TIGR02466 family)